MALSRRGAGGDEKVRNEVKSLTLPRYELTNTPIEVIYVTKWKLAGILHGHGVLPETTI